MLFTWESEFLDIRALSVLRLHISLKGSFLLGMFSELTTDGIKIFPCFAEKTNLAALAKEHQIVTGLQSIIPNQLRDLLATGETTLSSDQIEFFYEIKKGSFEVKTLKETSPKLWNMMLTCALNMQSYAIDDQSFQKNHFGLIELAWGRGGPLIIRC